MGQRSAGTFGPVPVAWLSYIRDFGRWLKANGATDADVLLTVGKPRSLLLAPTSSTRREIELFFTAAAQIEAQAPWRWQAVAFFTLMHRCGLRTGETRALQTGQVDLDGGHIDIVWSKGNRSRRLPFTGQVIEILNACDRTSRAHFASRRTFFFVSAAGNPVTAATVGKMFGRIWDQAGLARPAGGQQPRPYDFRHHFAYASIQRWMMQGKDVAAMLPYLSRYMGHATFDSTYYYIHTSPDFMDAYAQITRKSQSLLPEAGFE